MDVRKDQTRGGKHRKIDFAHTLKLESVPCFGNHCIVRLVKYCFMLEKYANYLTPRAEKCRRPLVVVCAKLKGLSPKTTYSYFLVKNSLAAAWTSFGSSKSEFSNLILGGGILKSESYKTSHNERALSSNPLNLC